MTGIIQETIDEVKDVNREVAWVGSQDGKYAISWEQFCAIPDEEYDAGYGAQEIASDLVVVFTDGSYLSRSEYDGSEGWELHTTPVKSKDPKLFDRVKVYGVGWETIEDIMKKQRARVGGDHK